MKKFKRMSMQISLIVNFFIALLIMNAFANSVMKKECYRLGMGMSNMALMMKTIHMLRFMQYTLNS